MLCFGDVAGEQLDATARVLGSRCERPCAIGVRRLLEFAGRYARRVEVARRQRHLDGCRQDSRAREAAVGECVQRGLKSGCGRDWFAARESKQRQAGLWRDAVFVRAPQGDLGAVELAHPKAYLAQLSRGDADVGKVKRRGLLDRAERVCRALCERAVLEEDRRAVRLAVAW